MRTTLDIPDDLFKEAMKITRCRTKIEVIKIVLENIVKKNNIQMLKQFRGKIDLDINLSASRKRD